MERYLSYQLDEAGRAYLAARGLLEAASSRRFGVVSNPLRPEHQKYQGRLVIPSFSAKGTVVDIAFRCIQDHDCGAEGCPKYLFLPGYEKRLYLVESVMTMEPVVHIAEGQLDAATLVACGLPAVGVPGAQAWKPHAHRLFQGFERVCFWADQDDKGASMSLFETIRRGVPNAEVITVPPGHDVNSFYVEAGREGIHALVAESYTGSNEEEVEDDDFEWEPPDVHYDEQGRVIPF